MSGWAVTPPARDHRVPTTGTRPEEEVGQAVDGAAQLLLDAVHDDGGVGRDGPGVVGHQQGAARPGECAPALPTRPGTSGGRSGRRPSGRAGASARCGPSRRRRTACPRRRRHRGSAAGGRVRAPGRCDVSAPVGEVDEGVGSSGSTGRPLWCGPLMTGRRPGATARLPGVAAPGLRPVLVGGVRVEHRHVDAERHRPVPPPRGHRFGRPGSGSAPSPSSPRPW